jgi:hypothetical protein
MVVFPEFIFQVNAIKIKLFLLNTTQIRMIHEPPMPRTKVSASPKDGTIIAKDLSLQIYYFSFELSKMFSAQSLLFAEI